MLVVGGSLVGETPSAYAFTSNGIDSIKVAEGETAVRGFTDFKADKERAEKWAKESYHKWKEKLTKEEQKSMEILKNPIDNQQEFYDINTTLKAFGGDVERRPIDQGHRPKTERYKKDIKNIEEALKRKEAKLNTNLYVYKNINFADFAEMNEKDFKNADGTINREKFKELKFNLSFGKNQEFTTVDLSETQGKDSGLLKWRIKLPKGTPTGHINENQLVLDRDIGLEVTDSRIITQKGKEYIRVEADLVPKEKIDKKVRENVTKLNGEINQLLEQPSETEMIEFRLHNLAGSVISEQGRELFRDVGSQIDNEILKKVSHFMSEKGGKIIIADITPAAIKESFEPLDQTEANLDYLMTAGGVYNKFNKTIVLDAKNSFKYGAKLDSGDFIHELGHATDYYAGELVSPGKNVSISGSSGFKKIFDVEKNNLTEYAKTNHREFWAEAFRLMHSKNPEDIKFVKEHAPQTYEFISKVLQVIRNLKGETK